MTILFIYDFAKYYFPQITCHSAFSCARLPTYLHQVPTYVFLLTLHLLHTTASWWVGTYIFYIQRGTEKLIKFLHSCAQATSSNNIARVHIYNILRSTYYSPISRWGTCSLEMNVLHFAVVAAADVDVFRSIHFRFLYKTADTHDRS